MPREAPHHELSATMKGKLILALLGSCAAVGIFQEYRSTARLTSDCLPGVPLEKSRQPHEQELGPLESTSLYEYQSVPCNISEIGHLPENTTRFQVSPMSAWTCRQEISDSYWLVFADFQIKECPPNYASSTFQLEGSTDNSRMMGRITGRRHFQDGCGIYNASVTIMDHPLPVGASSKKVTMELFWTSHFRKYSNRIKDIQDAHTIKAEDLDTEQSRAIFTEERLQYLERHLQPLFQRQLLITLNKPPQKQQPTHTPLPDCGTLPMEQWEPVGVFKDPTYNDSSPWGGGRNGEPHQWPYRSARCTFPARTLPELNDLLAGTRTMVVGDSHAENIANEVKHIMCPELIQPEHAQTAYYEHNYDCPYRNNSFSMGYRFFRGVYGQDMTHDYDAISGDFRQGSSTSCKRILKLGLYNATILLIPHWVFVYETQEGLDDFLLALKSMVLNCRASHAEEMKDHIFLLQSPTARDYLPFVQGSPLDLNPAHSWRGIHNHRLDVFTQKLKTEMAGLVDGVIPAFEMTLARMKTTRTRDGVHLPFDDYRELVYVQVAAIQSAMKYKRGLELPLKKADDPKARWFADQPVEWPLDDE